MGLQFDRPIGAPKDVAELEYCCAIRQTDTSRPLRANGSLTSDDVRLHMLSRHGVVATQEQVETLLMLQLAGGQEYAVPVAPAPTHQLFRGSTAAGTGSTSTAAEAEAAEHHHHVDRTVEEGGRGGGSGIDKLRISFADEGGNVNKDMGARNGDGGDGDGDGQAFRSSGGTTNNNGTNGGDGDMGASLNKGSTTTSAPAPMLLRRVTPLDLVQQVALLLIPELVKIQAEQDRNAKLLDNASEAQDDEDVEGGAMGARPSLMSARQQTSKESTTNFPQSVRNLFSKPAESELKSPTLDFSVVEVALLVLLENAGLVYGTELTTDVVHQLLLSLGEEYWDDDIVEQMIRLASGQEGKASRDDNEGELPVVKLTAETFLRALTADVSNYYDPQLEMRVTTHYADVSGPNNNNSSSNSATTMSARWDPTEFEDEGMIKSDPSAAASPVFTRVFTASSIDYTADTYASLTWAVLVWFLMAGFFFLYMFDGLQRRMFPLACNDEEFGCKIANAVVLWLEIMIKLCLVGFVYIGLSTLGNSVYLLTSDNSTALYKLKAAITIIISLATVYASTMLAYLVQVDAVVFDTTVPPPDDDYSGSVAYYIGDDPSLSSNATAPPKTQGNGRRQVDVLLGATLAVGFICMLTQLAQLIRAVLPRDLDAPARVSNLLASSANTMEHKTKTAASYKVREMVRNAVSCHALLTSPSDAGLATSVKYEAKNPLRLLAQNVDGRISHALFQFQERLQDKETVGGLGYTLNGLLRNGSPLATQEGIWVHPRLLWCNLGQWIVIVTFIVLLIQLPISLSEGFDVEGITVRQFKSVIVAGGIIGLIACFGTVTRFIPSAITTVLMFRSGVHSSLRDNRSFHVYRFAQDTSTALFGSAIWGLFFTGGIIWGVVSLLAFLFAWQDTRGIMLSLLSQIMGVVVTIVIKIIAMQILRRTWYGGFYRKRPGGANIFMVFIECWNLALSSGYILARSIKFILLSILYISRVDTPFLADGAGWLVGNIPLDAYAIAFRKDIIIHDAHRHPYMERWATLFLLKLRYQDDFGTQAGAAWRILFTMALMPWLRNYRVHPKLRASAWSTRHSSALLLGGGGAGTADSYEELYNKNQSLEREIQRLKKELAKAEEEQTSTHIHL